MNKVKVKVKRQGERFDLVDNEGHPFYAVDCIDISPIDDQGFAEVTIRVEVLNKNEWRHFVKKRRKCHGSR